MSLRLTLTCDGHRNGERCRGACTSSLAYSPTLRSDDPSRPIAFPGMWEGWRIGAATNGGDLCPSGGHDEDADDDEDGDQ